MHRQLISALALLPSLIAAQCYSGVNIIQARGTGESTQGSLQDVAANATLAAIPNSHLTRVSYPANFSFPISPNLGAQNMSNLINSYAQACPTSKIVVMGYSQGAEVAGLALTGGVNGLQALSQKVHNQIVSVILWGDINRQGNQVYDRGTCNKNSGVPRTGQAAEIFNSYAAETLSFCDLHDPVCCLGGDQLIAHVSYFTGANAQEVAQFVKQNFQGQSSNSTSGGSSARASASAVRASGAALVPTTSALGGGAASTKASTAASGATGASAATSAATSAASSTGAAGAAGGAAGATGASSSRAAPASTGAAVAQAQQLGGWLLAVPLVMAQMW